jgi:hypothetical protein
MMKDGLKWAREHLANARATVQGEACGCLDANALPLTYRHVVAFLIYGKSHLPIVDHARIELADTVA